MRPERKYPTPSTPALTVASTVELPNTDPVLQWNINMLQALSTATSSGVLQSRVAAIVETAVYDAVASFSEDAEPYAGIHIPPPPGASIDAAAIAAAHFALVNLIPAQSASLDTLYAGSLSARGLTTANPGVECRRTSRIEHSRGACGGWFRVGAVSLHGTRRGQSWRLGPHASSFRARVAARVGQRDALGDAAWIPVPCPAASAVDSDVYARDVEEVRNFGALNSIVRTSYQTEIAKWWPPSAVILWNPIARQVAVARGLSISENARLFALLNVAAADAAIACYESKYAYSVWRPISAIRNADGVRIPADPNWQPFLATPAFPEYPSAHNEISGAIAQILIAFFGDTPGVAMAAHSPANPAFDHFWTQFSEGIDEVINARVWEGIHFRNSDEQGMRAGRCVGQFVVRHALRLHGDRNDLNRGEAREDHHDGLRCNDLGHVGRDDRDDHSGR